jgi:hypothetical protein
MLDGDRHRAGGKRPWFGPKRFGWGYSPKTWQGWAILLVPPLVVILTTRTLDTAVMAASSRTCRHLTAMGLTGAPTAPVTGIGAAVSQNS